VISPEEAYERTRDALAILERGLMSSTRRRTGNAATFHFFNEGVVEEILKLRSQIDELIGLTAFLKEDGPPRPADDPPATANGHPAATSPSADTPTPAGA
jgi:hypothetical protein